MVVIIKVSSSLYDNPLSHFFTILVFIYFTAYKCTAPTGGTKCLKIPDTGDTANTTFQVLRVSLLYLWAPHGPSPQYCMLQYWCTVRPYLSCSNLPSVLCLTAAWILTLIRHCQGTCPLSICDTDYANDWEYSFSTTPGIPVCNTDGGVWSFPKPCKRKSVCLDVLWLIDLSIDIPKSYLQCQSWDLDTYSLTSVRI